MKLSHKIGSMLVPHTKQTVHMGVGCVFAPQPVIDSEHSIRFQGELSSHGLVFTQIQNPPGSLILLRDPRALEVRVQQVGPGVGSVVVIAPQPWATLGEFLDEVQTVFSAYGATWSGQQMQVLQRECTVRQLYGVTEDHAFKFLWEQRLRATEDELRAFGRPVLGGGLRFVIPPSDPHADEANIQVRIESFLPDPSKLLVEVQMQWSVMQIMDELDPGPILGEADRFLSEEAVRFITGGQL
jgi:hypothetical protein